jgi:hypothetical protein
LATYTMEVHSKDTQLQEVLRRYLPARAVEIEKGKPREVIVFQRRAEMNELARALLRVFGSAVEIKTLSHKVAVYKDRHTVTPLKVPGC